MKDVGHYRGLSADVYALRSEVSVSKSALVFRAATVEKLQSVFVENFNLIVVTGQEREVEEEGRDEKK